MSNAKTILVTGANRGIGLEIVRQLAGSAELVVLASRDEAAGRKAAAQIAAPSVHYLQLDVADDRSIARAAEEFARLDRALDVLINNAGIYPDQGTDILTLTREQLAHTFQTNAFGALRVTQAFLPYLRKAEAARVVNVSSGYGQIEGLSAQVPSYCLSKLTLNGITLMLEQALHQFGIAVNSMCPGWVRTDMGGADATRSVPEGADTAVWLAGEAPQNLSGKFVRDRQVIPF